MNKKILIVLISIFYSYATQAEITSKLILESKLKGKDSFSIAVSPLTEIKQMKDWVSFLTSII